jgi:hypothetical protein
MFSSNNLHANDLGIIAPGCHSLRTLLQFVCAKHGKKGTIEDSNTGTHLHAI